MPTMNPANETVQTMRVAKDLLINASIDIVWEAVLEECGPGLQPEPGKQPLQMKLEAWPGGRWFRDLGEGKGHLWGHVQVIKPPTLLEICGPMFMSYPATNHIEYRLKAEGEGTRFKFAHRGIGIFDAEHLKGVDMGWGEVVENIRKAAEARARR